MNPAQTNPVDQRWRYTKIVATVGPSCAGSERIRSLFDAGVDAFRINMSHTSHEALAQTIADIREIEKDAGRPITVIADLQGPKIRIGRFATGEVRLKNGDQFTLTQDPAPGSRVGVNLPHPNVLRVLDVGARVLLSDGRITLRVVSTESADPLRVTCEVHQGGILKDRQGVNLPDTNLPLPAMTDKDRADLACALENQVDVVAVSFVRTADDLACVHEAVRGRAMVLAKIEKPQALEHIDEIIELSDMAMVARGDLGVEVPLERLPGIQRRLVRMLRERGKPVVIATQMLESMITSPVPTRAEVSDVATAVCDGADAVMLSAESASGSYPVEAVRTMDRIVRAAEASPDFRAQLHSTRTPSEETAADALAAAAEGVAQTLNLPAIVCYTKSGSTGMRVARTRPMTRIVALTPHPTVSRWLNLVWGIHSVLSPDATDSTDMIDRASTIVMREGVARPGERVVVLAGLPLGTPGATNMLRIAQVDVPEAQLESGRRQALSDNKPTDSVRGA